VNEKVAAPVKETEINGREDPLRWPRDTLYPQKSALTSLTCGGRSVGIIRLWTKGHGVLNDVAISDSVAAHGGLISELEMVWKESVLT
jgi:hypothetical protein